MKINAHALAAHGALKVSVPPRALGTAVAGFAAERNLAPSAYFVAARQLRHVGVRLEANGALIKFVLFCSHRLLLRKQASLGAPLFFLPFLPVI